MRTYKTNKALTWAGHGPWSLGPSPALPWAHVSALVPIFVCANSTLIYVISFRKPTTCSYSKKVPGRMRLTIEGAANKCSVKAA